MQKELCYGARPGNVTDEYGMHSRMNSSRFLLAAGMLLFALWIEPAPAAETFTVPNAEEFFPDGKGSRWQYRGQVIEGPLSTIAQKTFSNVSVVKGAEKLKGVSVRVFHDSNPGGHEPSESYYRRDAAGIVYYGSTPGSPLEKQLVPYQIVRFPLEYPSGFQQFNRQGVTYGMDVDGDEKDEQVDVEATVNVVGLETVQVPAGTYKDTVRLESKMTMRIHLTKDRETVVGTDTMNVWFARGVGVVKYIERQEFPSIKGDRGMVTETTEELEEVEIKKE
jgi:hypothetical protein